MSQLYMLRPNLDELPAIPALPDGYTLRKFVEADLKSLGATLAKAFENDEWNPNRVREVLTEHADVPATFVIDYHGWTVATASALLSQSAPKGLATLHWVGADAGHAGKRLGYIVSLAVLHECVKYGCTSADLLTDDGRLPAIKTYLNLGFRPIYRDETHKGRWVEIRKKLAG
jgi:mycothiol synthase